MRLANQNGGFIALVSVIVITFVVLTTVITLSATGFLDRFNILDGEAKEVSASLASACADSARLKIARDGTYAPNNEVIHVENNDCTIVSVTHSGYNSTIHAQGIYRGATTNYEVIIDGNQEVVSWQEMASF